MPDLNRRRFLTGLAVISASPVLLSARPASAAPKPDLWPVWQAHDATSTTTVDHAVWTGFLSRFLKVGKDGINRLDYKGAASGPGKAQLSGYVKALQAVKVSSMNRDEQFAYWVNLYNARTVHLVLEDWPVTSIKQVRGGLFNTGPWGDKTATVEGRKLSLDDIEHRILRPIWKDPRIQYAVNCASIGCPNLATTAYTAANHGELMEQGARAYINHPRGVTHLGGGRFRYSSIYKWFDEDFGGNDAGILAHFKKYAGPELQSAFDANSLLRLTEDRYDWSLNAVG
ncbi:MAG: DUF547 domain-containing protein [Alphaproteobacteria bacterium]